jgi:hypothetical protein
LVFTPANWNKPQRVVVRGVDDHVVNSDRALLIQVGADGYLQKKNLPVRMLNDDLPALRGDFNSDSSVDGRDFLAWQRSAGMGWNATRSQGDADADTDVDHVDLAAWTVEFGGPAAPPSADFDGSGQVNSADLAAWRGGYGNAVNATPAAGDADLDHDVDGRDFLAWQRAFGGGGAAEAIAAASTANAAATAASGLNMLSGLPSLQGVAIPAHGGIAAARSMAQESAAKERDLAFGSLGDFVQEGDDGGRTDADAYQTNSLDEMRGSIDECLGEALDDDGVWRHFLPLA